MASSTPSSPSSRRRQSTHTMDGAAVSLHSRRSSQASALSTHRRRTSDNPLSPGVGGQQELGDSLADELADAWDDDNDDTYYEEPADTSLSELGQDVPQTPQAASPVATRDEASTPGPTTANGSSSPSKRNATPRTPSARHARNRSLYDGADYPALESEYSGQQAIEFSKDLEMAIRDVEKLALQGKAPSKNEPAKDVVASLLANLQDLGNQSSLEMYATRLITAHAAVNSQLGFQTRALQNVSYPLLSPLSQPPPLDVLDELLPLLTETLTMIPQPSHTALNSVTHLSTASRESIASLATLSDSLHMCRQVEQTAGRRLKSAREGVSEMGREYEAADVGQAYIQRGNWDQRIHNREAARECQDIVNGFEAKCGQMRERLAASAAAAG